MPTPPAPGYARQLWLKWKALRLPWRRQFLVGADLAGNTFWEFKDAINAGRWRRIVKYSRQAHYADVKISPQWHQWLRHTREAAPSIQEQQFDVSRQAMLKQLAAQADERWNSKPSFLDAPARQQPVPAIGVNDPGGYVPAPTEDIERQGVRSAVESSDPEDAPDHEATQTAVPATDKKARKMPKENPWKGPERGAPSENWQPQSWTPGPAPRR